MTMFKMCCIKKQVPWIHISMLIRWPDHISCQMARYYRIKENALITGTSTGTRAFSVFFQNFCYSPYILSQYLDMLASLI